MARGAIFSRRFIAILRQRAVAAELNMDSAGNSHFISAHGDPLGLAVHCVIGGMGSLSSAVAGTLGSDRTDRLGGDPRR
jgi:hypothetical protein